MAMSYKITSRLPAPKMPEYPCLKVRKSIEVAYLYVLFIAEDAGFVVGPNEQYKLGYFWNDWPEDEFELFEGTVTLENK